jgi:hypothetical protein
MELPFYLFPEFKMFRDSFLLTLSFKLSNSDGRLYGWHGSNFYIPELDNQINQKNKDAFTPLRTFRIM